MTPELQLNPTAPDPFLQRLTRVKRHSLRVARMKRVFPIAALGLVIASIVGIYFSAGDSIDIKFEDLGLENGRVVMKNPELAGQSGNGESFFIAASKASQDPFAPQQIEFSDVLANLPVGSGAVGVVSALGGEYDANSQILKLDEEILFELEDGSTLSMGNAVINLLDGTLNSTKPLSIEYKGGSLRAQRIEITEHGDIISMRDGVSLVITPDMLSGDVVQGSKIE